jgi:hypothetical protein
VEARHNRNTGAILFDERNALGCIEGTRAAVEEALDTIKRFSRFVRLTVIMDESAGERSLDKWVVAIVQPTKSKLLNESTGQWKRIIAKARGETRMSA